VSTFGLPSCSCVLLRHERVGWPRLFETYGMLGSQQLEQIIEDVVVRLRCALDPRHWGLVLTHPILDIEGVNTGDINFE
jgi:hypothetical protein